MYFFHTGDYGGPMFLLPGLVTTIYITKIDFPKEKKQAMIGKLVYMLANVLPS